MFPDEVHGELLKYKMNFSKQNALLIERIQSVPGCGGCSAPPKVGSNVSGTREIAPPSIVHVHVHFHSMAGRFSLKLCAERRERVLRASGSVLCVDGGQFPFGINLSNYVAFSWGCAAVFAGICDR